MSQSNPPDDETQPDPTPAQKWIRSPQVEYGSPAFKYLTEDAGIAPGIVEAANKVDALREGPNATAWFPHRNSEGEITGVSGKGHDFGTMLIGSHKSLVRMPGSEATSRIVLTEQPIEALAVAQIEKFRADTLYVATGGGFAAWSRDSLNQELLRIKDEPNAELAIATGRSTDAAIAAVQAKKLATEVGVPTTRHIPPDQSFTWYTYLKDNPNADTLTPAAGPEAASKPAGETVAAAGTQPAARPLTAPEIPKPDPLAELLEQLKQATANSNLPEMNDIKDRIKDLLDEQQNPAVSQQPIYRMKVAWVLMDVEKLTGADMRIDEDLRRDLARQATRIPGLTNSDVGSLLAATKNLPEPGLVQDIRGLAIFVAAQPSPQITTEILQKTNHMKERVLDAVINMGGDNARVQTISAKAGQAAASSEQTAQSTQQTAQSTQHTAQETTQKVDQAEVKINQNHAAAQSARNEKAAGAQAVAAAPTVVAPVRSSGDFLQTLSNIAMTWHDYTHGPNSSSAKRAAAKATEVANDAAAGVTAPSPAPGEPPPPAATMGARQVDDRPVSAPAAPAEAATRTAPEHTPSRPSFVDYAKESLFGATRPTETQTARADAPANWPKTPDQGIGSVMASIGGNASQSRIDAATARTAESAMAAASAVKDLMEGPGREFVARIAGAARAEGGNVETVIAEMRPDGKYGGLRVEFDASVKQNTALTAAVDRAIATMNAYGENRSKLENLYHRFERDTVEVEAKFKSVDETLAKAAQAFPGETPGTALIENLGEKIREALRRAIATVRQIIGLDAGQTIQPRHDHSPGMGM